MTTTEILNANNWPENCANSVERVLYLLERQDEIELLRIVAGVFEALGMQFAARQVQHRPGRTGDLSARASVIA
jgi:hypothetical protein